MCLWMMFGSSGLVFCDACDVHVIKCVGIMYEVYGSGFIILVVCGM